MILEKDEEIKEQKNIEDTGNAEGIDFEYSKVDYSAISHMLYGRALRTGESIEKLLQNVRDIMFVSFMRNPLNPICLTTGEERLEIHNSVFSKLYIEHLKTVSDEQKDMFMKAAIYSALKFRTSSHHIAAWQEKMSFLITDIATTYKDNTKVKLKIYCDPIRILASYEKKYLSYSSNLTAYISILASIEKQHTVLLEVIQKHYSEIIKCTIISGNKAVLDKIISFRATPKKVDLILKDVILTLLDFLNTIKIKRTEERAAFLFSISDKLWKNERKKKKGQIVTRELCNSVVDMFRCLTAFLAFNKPTDHNHIIEYYLPLIGQNIEELMNDYDFQTTKIGKKTLNALYEFIFTISELDVKAMFLVKTENPILNGYASKLINSKYVKHSSSNANINIQIHTSPLAYILSHFYTDKHLHLPDFEQLLMQLTLIAKTSRFYNKSSKVDVIDMNVLSYLVITYKTEQLLNVLKLCNPKERALLMSCKDYDGRSPIWYAYLQGMQCELQLESMRFRPDTNTLLAICHGSKTGNIETLCSKEAINNYDANGMNAMHYAMYNKHHNVERIVSSLHAHGINSNARDKHSLTPLMHGVIHNNINAVRALLMHVDNIDVNAADTRGRTALMHAIIYGNPDMISALLDDYRVDARKMDIYGINPISMLIILNTEYNSQEHDIEATPANEDFISSVKNAIIRNEVRDLAGISLASPDTTKGKIVRKILKKLLDKGADPGSSYHRSILRNLIKTLCFSIISYIGIKACAKIIVKENLAAQIARVYVVHSVVLPCVSDVIESLCRAKDNGMDIFSNNFEELGLYTIDWTGLVQYNSTALSNLQSLFKNVDGTTKDQHEIREIYKMLISRYESIQLHKYDMLYDGSFINLPIKLITLPYRLFVLHKMQAKISENIVKFIHDEHNIENILHSASINNNFIECLQYSVYSMPFLKKLSEDKELVNILEAITKYNIIVPPALYSLSKDVLYKIHNKHYDKVCGILEYIVQEFMLFLYRIMFHTSVYMLQSKDTFKMHYTELCNNRTHIPELIDDKFESYKDYNHSDSDEVDNTLRGAVYKNDTRILTKMGLKIFATICSTAFSSSIFSLEVIDFLLKKQRLLDMRDIGENMYQNSPNIGIKLAETAASVEEGVLDAIKNLYNRRHDTAVLSTDGIGLAAHDDDTSDSIDQNDSHTKSLHRRQTSM